MSGTLKSRKRIARGLVALVGRKIHAAGEQFGDLRGPRRLDGQVLLELYVETWTDIEGAVAERRGHGLRGPTNFAAKKNPIAQRPGERGREFERLGALP